jgi:hypothetical protein
MRVASQEFVLACISGGMSILGRREAESALRLIEQRSGLRRSDFPFNPDAFTIAMRGIFGVGSGILLKSILREIGASRAFAGDRDVFSFSSKLTEACKEIEDGTM